MTQAAVAAIGSADVIVGYKVYIPFVENLVKPGAEIVCTGMKQERDRVERALAIAAGGRDVCVVSSGDSHPFRKLLWRAGKAEATLLPLW